MRLRFFLFDLPIFAVQISLARDGSVNSRTAVVAAAASSTFPADPMAPGIVGDGALNMHVVEALGTEKAVFQVEDFSDH